MKSTCNKLSAAILLSLGLSSTAWAEPAISPCGGVTRLDTLVEPWSESTRTFANGNIRIAHVDTGEPACCSYHLVILAPNPEDELGYRQCVALNDGGEWTGFQSIDFAGIESSYEPGLGLLLSVPAERYIDGHQSTPLLIGVRINQATGAITIE